MSDHPIHNTDGVTAQMVESLGDDTPAAPPQAFAAPATGDPYAVAPSVQGHEPSGPCASCKKELGALRAALVVLAVVIGLLAMLYLAQRRGLGHGHSDENASQPNSDQ